MTIERPDRAALATAIRTAQQTQVALEAWQAKLTTAMAAPFDQARQLHDAAVQAAVAATVLPPIIAADSKPVTPALAAAGITTLGELQAVIYTEANVAGLSAATCKKLRQFCSDQVTAVAESTPLRLDFDRDPQHSADLCRSALAWPVLQVAQQALAPVADTVAALGLTVATLPLNRLTPLGWWLTGATRKAQLATAATQVIAAAPATAQALADAVAPLVAAQPLALDAVRARFEADAASFYALFEQLELAGTAPTAVALDPFADLIQAAPTAADPTQAALQTLVRRVGAIDYTNPYLTATLRGWQAFGTRYALAQRKVLLGDEMGLGKTLEALGVITSRLAAGDTHALVVAPVSLLTNWRREVRKHTTLVPRILHGDDRAAQLAAWQAQGGVAVINYDQLWRLPASALTAVDVLVADEAQALLNPQAKRTQAVTRLARQADTVMYMTGTPIQNRLEDMLNLIAPLQPAICAQLAAGPQLYAEDAFKRVVAPVYLRRNRADVLKELPPLERQDVWVDFSPAERAQYQVAVHDGNFMAMRQAAWLPTEPAAQAPKRAWLVNLAQEAVANGHKVLVFSYFRRVLDLVEQDLGALCLPPITGSLSLGERQALLDEFVARRSGAVLCAQIQTLGQGVNLQAADTVVFAEPQLTPATEAQALSRVYRMGQTRSVTVYRLLTEHAIDQLIRARAAHKQAVFDQFAKDSSVAAATEDATAQASSALLSQLVAQAAAQARPDADWDQY
ncbi:DEAD/DEAH box helicase [Lacticaseibacillus absianus]|uniref:DEAD/DEAH box helicase n=1 Tax=Lacticaseibacillus absianus TaxID=2729623 RepID=UPI0015C86A80|nr:DEAD/DEAH box helicase [Lacticaseibacillus absianus]